MRFVVLVLTILFISSCTKENDFEDATLNNEYKNNSVDFVSIDSSNAFQCDVVRFYYSVKNENLPDSIIYTHVLFKDERNVAVKIAKSKDFVVLNTSCNGSTTFFITLYHEGRLKESHPTIYTYNP